MEEQGNRTTPIHPWGPGGPKNAEHKALAKQWFLENLPCSHTVSAACEYAGIDRKTAYRWKDQDTKFSDAWDVAVEKIHDIARQSIFQRGILGWDEPVVAQGRVALDENDERLTVHKWSDSLAALYARANLPEYKDKQQLDINLKMAEEAEKAKESLLASLGVAIDENSKAAPQG